MAHFLKPASIRSSHYVLDSDGTLKSIQVPLGETVVVDLWGGGDIVGGKGEILRVDVDNHTVATVSKKKDPGDDWISSWSVQGNMKDKATLVALDPSGRVFAKVPLEIASLQAQHQWNTNQPAPQEVWRITKLYIPRTRWLGIWMPPGYEDHSEGRAVDIGLWAWVPEEKDVAEAIVELLKKKMAEVGWSYFIWNKQIWLNDKPAPEVYKGKSAHTEHIHISWNRETSQRRSFPTFGAELAKIGSTYPGAAALAKK